GEGPGEGLVVEELRFRQAPEADALAGVTPQKRRGTPQGARRLALRVLVAERRVVAARKLKVRGDLHAGEGQEADAGVVHLARDQQRKLGADLIADTVWAGRSHV